MEDTIYRSMGNLHCDETQKDKLRDDGGIVSGEGAASDFNIAIKTVRSGN
jgi:hypothetical protein